MSWLRSLTERWTTRVKEPGCAYWIRGAMRRATGWNCLYADDDLLVLELLARNAVWAGELDGLTPHIQERIRAYTEGK